MSGFNMPPGVSVNDIPGNRREDDVMQVIQAAYAETGSRDPHTIIRHLATAVLQLQWDLENCNAAVEALARRKTNAP